MSNKRQLQLGMNPSTAQNALKKQLMFHLAKKCGMDVCFQCGDIIESSDQLSVEHKVPWLDSENPVDLFFDLNNVAFSHLSCNVKAGRKPHKGTFTHGSRSAYQTHNCRCELCVTNYAKIRKRLYKPELRKARYERTGH